LDNPIIHLSDEDKQDIANRVSEILRSEFLALLPLESLIMALTSLVNEYSEGKRIDNSGNRIK
jgi:hypothetical protein